MTFLCIGTYLGYSKSPKFREWISDLTAEELKRIDQRKAWQSRCLWCFSRMIWNKDHKISVPLQIGSKDGSCVILSKFVLYDVCNNDCVSLELILQSYLLQCTSVESIRYLDLVQMRRLLDGMPSVRSSMATSGIGDLQRRIKTLLLYNQACSCSLFDLTSGDNAI